MKLSALQEKFVLHWGEMGTRWGVNRTVAQIHALLYISPRPLHAEEIAETLSVARSNVSTSLKELQGWQIVRVVHVLGDRRDHFESLKDVFAMFHDRLKDMLGFFETMTGWYTQVRGLPQQAVVKFVRMGGQMRKWLGLAS
jgi:DNA-binding transcriptional regulator GbsR (MarR family)